jgi:hypothetical protein
MIKYSESVRISWEHLFNNPLANLKEEKLEQLTFLDEILDENIYNFEDF